MKETDKIGDVQENQAEMHEEITTMKGRQTNSQPDIYRPGGREADLKGQTIKGSCGTDRPIENERWYI